MKKILLTIAAMAVFAVLARAQTNDYTIRSVRDPVQLVAKINADMAAVDARIDAAESTVASLVQRDTNDTTTVTSYSAPQVSALLVGKDGGTSVVWIATASGTNGWVKAIEN